MWSLHPTTVLTSEKSHRLLSVSEVVRLPSLAYKSCLLSRYIRCLAHCLSSFTFYRSKVPLGDFGKGVVYVLWLFSSFSDDSSKHFVIIKCPLTYYIATRQQRLFVTKNFFSFLNTYFVTNSGCLNEILVLCRKGLLQNINKTIFLVKQKLLKFVKERLITELSKL